MLVNFNLSSVLRMIYCNYSKALVYGIIATLSTEAGGRRGGRKKEIISIIQIRGRFPQASPLLD